MNTENKAQELKPPQIITDLVRDPETHKVVGFKSIDFTPGTIIERCGRKYEVQKNGSQRKVK